jgi:hypothetical protein
MRYLPDGFEFAYLYAFQTPNTFIGFTDPGMFMKKYIDPSHYLIRTFGYALPAGFAILLVKLYV